MQVKLLKRGCFLCITPRLSERMERFSHNSFPQGVYFPVWDFYVKDGIFVKRGCGFFFVVESSHRDGSGMVFIQVRNLSSIVDSECGTCVFQTPVVVGDFLNLSGVLGLWDILGRHFRMFIVKVELFVGKKYILGICHWLRERERERSFHI